MPRVSPSLLRAERGLCRGDLGRLSAFATLTGVAADIEQAEVSPAGVVLDQVPDDGDEWETERQWIAKLAYLDFTAPDDPAEQALLAFVLAVVEAPRVADDVFERDRRQLSARQIVEVLQLVGFYWALGRICTVLDLELDHPSGLDSILAVANLRG